MDFFSIFKTYNADDILGVWITLNADAHIEIFKDENKYFGKTIWYNESKYEGIHTDILNPDPVLRTRPVKNLVVLHHLSFSGNNLWDNASCYDPESGNTYNGYIKMHDYDTLHLRGYIGLPIFGKTEKWKRLKIK